MSVRVRCLAVATLCLVAAALAPAAAQADSTAWQLTLTPIPASPSPGGEDEFFAVATNVGGAPSTGTSVVEVTLPTGITPVGFEAINSDQSAAAAPTCEIAPQLVTCETTEVVHPGRLLLIKIRATVGAPEGPYEATATVSGGGASALVEASAPIAVQPGPVPFGFLPGFAAPLSEADGSPATLAGAHPYQQTIDFGFPTKKPGNLTTNAGRPRDIAIELPRGLVGDPAATPVLCTEARLVAFECPDESQVGITDVTTLLTGKQPTVFSTALYNMVPPPGTPAVIATNVASVGIFAHIFASVRTDGDYGVLASLRDILAFPGQPIFNVQSQLWGDPSAAAHDSIRGVCREVDATCPIPSGETPLLTTPGDCPEAALSFEVRADSWEEPTPPFEERKADYDSADLTGLNPISLAGCGELDFKPTIEAQPTTDHADSPSGLQFDLHQPQQGPSPEPLAGRATAILKDATISFPAGMAVNPSQAAGLDACTEAQIGFAGEVTEGEEAGVQRFSKDPQSCPDAAKIGTVDASSPLLVQRNEAHETQRDGEGRPLPEPLHGSVYLAKPFDNPFGSLVALYLAVEDPKTGIVAKLAGEGELDPNTGQITTRFEHNPEIPIEDIRVHIFGGDRGALITPPSCGSYSTEAVLTPWSAPEGLVAHPSGSFAIDQAAGGGPCPAAAPWAPQLSAGTLEPAAGKYSPLLFKLTRSDGSQRLASVEASLPPGLTAKLAGVGQCPDAEIAKAISREHPNGGAAEIADPSCPVSSQVGSVDVGAGAGPSPFHTSGRAYLAGPYKGAPLSFVIITPAVAGPFDLGTVVVRAAVYLDPETAQPRTVSDPLPQLIDGIPVDVRSVSLRIDRPSFALNPTSCDEESFSGQASSAFGQIALLSERFRVGGCRALPYKPKLSTRLFGPVHRGGHPRLRAIFTAKPGEANTARISFALPRSEFIDQAHFRTICTRVQFAAKACPAGSVYGHMKAITPLLDYPLEGPIYLRSSSHELPDVVAALSGPPSQPIEFDLDGRVDSVHGGVRTIFAIVPDAPVSKAIVTLQGAGKGLFQNSTNICKGTYRATLKLDAQNGKTHDTRPLLKASCPKKANPGTKKHKRHRRHHSKAS